MATEQSNPITVSHAAQAVSSAVNPAPALEPGVQRVISRWWLGLVIAAVPGCLDPLIEDPGAQGIHGPAPIHTAPGVPGTPPVAPGPIEPTMTSVPGSPVTPGAPVTPATPPGITPPTPPVTPPTSTSADVGSESPVETGGAGPSDAGVAIVTDGTETLDGGFESGVESFGTSHTPPTSGTAAASAGEP